MTRAADAARPRAVAEHVIVVVAVPAQQLHRASIADAGTDPLFVTEIERRARDRCNLPRGDLGLVHRRVPIRRDHDPVVENRTAGAFARKVEVGVVFRFTRVGRSVVARYSIRRVSAAESV